MNYLAIITIFCLIFSVWMTVVIADSRKPVTLPVYYLLLYFLSLSVVLYRFGAWVLGFFI